VNSRNAGYRLVGSLALGGHTDALTPKKEIGTARVRGTTDTRTQNKIKEKEKKKKEEK